MEEFSPLMPSRVHRIDNSFYVNELNAYQNRNYDLIEPDEIKDEITPDLHFSVLEPEQKLSTKLKYKWIVYQDLYKKSVSPSLDDNSKPNSEEYANSLTVVGSFVSLESFDLLWNKVTKDNTGFQIFREGIKPLWEEDANKEGGKYFFPNITIQEWIPYTLAKIIIQNKLIDCDEINGIAFSYRKGSFVPYIWNKYSNDKAKINLTINAIKTIISSSSENKDGLYNDMTIRYKKHPNNFKVNSIKEFDQKPLTNSNLLFFVPQNFSNVKKVKPQPKRPLFTKVNHDTTVPRAISPRITSPSSPSSPTRNENQITTSFASVSSSSSKSPVFSFENTNFVFHPQKTQNNIDGVRKTKPRSASFSSSSSYTSEDDDDLISYKKTLKEPFNEKKQKKLIDDLESLNALEAETGSEIEKPQLPSSSISSFASIDDWYLNYPIKNFPAKKFSNNSPLIKVNDKLENFLGKFSIKIPNFLSCFDSSLNNGIIRDSNNDSPKLL